MTDLADILGITAAWPKDEPGQLAGALCAQMDPEDFFPHATPPDHVLDACRQCPVRAQCLEMALNLMQSGLQVHGIWAGTTQPDRDRLVDNARRCELCPAPIDHRRANARFCERCAEIRRAETQAAHQKRRNWTQPNGRTA